MNQKDATRAQPIENQATVRREPEEPEPRSAHTGTEDELGLFFAQSLDLLCVAGFDGYFKRLNPAWTSCLGWTLEELKAKPFFNFVHHDDRAATQAQIDRRNRGKKVILFENRYRHRDGSYRWLRWNAQLEQGGQRIYATARDVTEQKRLERMILEISDREKEHLGRELHDGLCQTLAGIAALSTTLSRELAAKSEAAMSAAAAEIAQLLNEAINEAHTLAHGLSPVGLAEDGLDEALETLALNVQHRFGVSCTLESVRPFARLDHGVEANLFRIAQEAVSNALTHGKGDRIEIGLGSHNGQGVLSVRDDGVGIPEKARNAGGIGMYTMEYRARLIGGSLAVRRRTPCGTAVTCTFSLPGIPDSKRAPGTCR